MRVLYSQAESFNILSYDLMILRDLIKDLYRVDLHKLNIQKVGPPQLGNYFMNVKTLLENEIKDSHLTVIDGY
jgi:hypothetical protein